MRARSKTKLLLKMVSIRFTFVYSLTVIGTYFSSRIAHVHSREFCNGLPDKWNTAKTSTLQAGEVLTISCYPGFSNIGDRVVTCISNTEYSWSSKEPHCLKRIASIFLQFQYNSNTEI